MKLLYVTNNCHYFLLHRLHLARAAKAAGYEIHVAGPVDEHLATLTKEGFHFHQISLISHSLNPINELITLINLFKLYRQIKPDLVHHFSVKPILYGGIAARLLKIPRVVNSVSGLGYIFINQNPAIKILRQLLKPVYGFALNNKNCTSIFENPDDQQLFIHSNLVAEKLTTVIKGVGIDLSTIRARPEPPLPITIILVARMLWDKGIGEFIEAAQILRQKYAVRCVLVGGELPKSHAAIPKTQLQQWVQTGNIEWWGWQENMEQVYHQAHVVCLPSYREGLPRSLIEAAAYAKPIVTTDAPGCREVVKDKINGFLVPLKDALTLAAALEKLINDEVLRQQMGNASRQFAIEQFSIENVIAKTLHIYNAELC